MRKIIHIIDRYVPALEDETVLGFIDQVTGVALTSSMWNNQYFIPNGEYDCSGDTYFVRGSVYNMNGTIHLDKAFFPIIKGLDIRPLF